jgi:hypothetical protein
VHSFRRDECFSVSLLITKLFSLLPPPTNLSLPSDSKQSQTPQTAAIPRLTKLQAEHHDVGDLKAAAGAQRAASAGSHKNCARK